MERDSSTTVPHTFSFIFIVADQSMEYRRRKCLKSDIKVLFLRKLKMYPSKTQYIKQLENIWWLLVKLRCHQLFYY